MLLLASYNVLLSKYTGQEDIVVGTPVEGRRHADLHGLIGMFVNTWQSGVILRRIRRLRFI
jgi:non-ribosomal peptide synthetase component F